MIKKEDKIKFFKSIVSADGECCRLDNRHITCMDCKNIVAKTNLFSKKDVEEIIAKTCCISFLDKGNKS